MRLLALVDRETYLTKLSRVRFHSLEAIGRLCELRWSGPGWPGWDVALTVDANVARSGWTPDLIEVYMPFGDQFAGNVSIKGIADTSIPVCLRYNEAFKVKRVKNEIESCRADLVVFHHENEMRPYLSLRWKHGRVSCAHIPHSAEPSIFRPYGEPKTTDLMLVGALGPRYPLRNRLAKLLPRFPRPYRAVAFEHPGYVHADAHTDRYAERFARAISATQICLSCSGRTRTRYGKYVEVPMCGTALAADMPEQDQDRIGKWLIELDLGMTDRQIIDKLVAHLEDPREMSRRVEAGLAWARQYTQQHYAERFVAIAEEFVGQRRSSGR
ncbi:MAG TPA: hypothetical protein VD788_06680 [Candidatus Polarisedimenticolaceae bacterium]|nr:hypothetical protein [Candidatus Polarisedimenticolaceae bacterium]